MRALKGTYLDKAVVLEPDKTGFIEMMKLMMDWKSDFKRLIHFHSVAYFPSVNTEACINMLFPFVNLLQCLCIFLSASKKLSRKKI